MILFEGQEALTSFFKALMHPVRIAILDMLRDGEQCVCHLEAALGMRQAYVSQQLAVLREAGIVADERDGLNVFYRVVRPSVYPVLDAARTMQGLEPVFVYPLEKRANAACPCPKCVPVTPENSILERKA